GARERGEERAARGEPACSVKKDERIAVARFECLDRPAAAGDFEEPRAGGHRSISAVEAPGTARVATGWIQKRSSPSYSGQRDLRRGITSAAKSWVEWRVFSGGMSPT